MYNARISPNGKSLYPLRTNQHRAGGRADFRSGCSQYLNPGHGHAFSDAGFCQSRGMAGKGRLPSQANPGKRRAIAVAGEDAAPRASLRQDRAGRLYGREGAARNVSRFLPGRQFVPAARQARSLSGNSFSTRTLGLRPAGEYPSGLSARALHQPGAARICGLQLRHGRL